MDVCRTTHGDASAGQGEEVGMSYIEAQWSCGAGFTIGSLLLLLCYTRLCTTVILALRVVCLLCIVGPNSAEPSVVIHHLSSPSTPTPAQKEAFSGQPCIQKHSGLLYL